MVRAIVLVVLVAAGLTALALSPPAQRTVMRLLETAKTIIENNPFLGAALFVVLSALAAMLAFFSSAVLVPAAVYAWGPVGCAALLWGGWMLGGLASYALAYRYGTSVLRWLAPGKAIEQYQERLRKKASFGFIILFQMALPSELPGLVLGLCHFPIERYLLALAIAELPYAIGTTLLGASFVERRFGFLISLGALAAVSVLVLGRTFRRRLSTPSK